MKQAPRPILITDASRSQDDQLRSRQVRYVVMMSIRAACLIIAAVLVGAEAPLLWLWLPICAVGMIIVPWLAVLIANDGPPKQQHRRFGQRSQRDPTPPPSLPTKQEPRTIDVDP
ncbi:MAG TPA: DUF3099 domain-containing protein [Micromonosporaceae bacterium]|nr:DUF3099 domain-containing protein [Micromonosporaceae bacterium]